MKQLVLDVRRDDRAVFDNFYAASNQQVVAYLRDLLQQQLGATGGAASDVGGRIIYLWGGPGSGKSHLLSAVAEQVRLAGEACIWWSPLAPVTALPFCVCVDNLSVVRGVEGAEPALLSVYERVKKAGGVLMLAATHPPSSMALNLPDLVSRLNAAQVFEVRPLSDQQKREALRSRADKRGFALSAEVLSWLLLHASRDMGYLFNLLDQVDTATLEQQRKVSVPMIKRIIADAADAAEAAP